MGKTKINMFDKVLESKISKYRIWCGNEASKLDNTKRKKNNIRILHNLI
jgi:hypothetical protein